MNLQVEDAEVAVMLSENQEIIELSETKRRAIIVWVYSLKQLKQLRKFGYIHYVSRKMKYIVIYVDDVDAEMTKEKLEKLFFVRQVELSYRPDINMNFNNRLGNKDKFAEDEPIEFEEQNTEIKLAEFND